MTFRKPPASRRTRGLRVSSTRSWISEDFLQIFVREILEYADLHVLQLRRSPEATRLCLLRMTLGPFMAFFANGPYAGLDP
jgi:hypothetical protein